MARILHCSGQAKKRESKTQIGRQWRLPRPNLCEHLHTAKATNQANDAKCCTRETKGQARAYYVGITMIQPHGNYEYHISPSPRPRQK